MNHKLYKTEEFQICIISLLAALLIASNQIINGGIEDLFSNYIYWISRIFIEATFFVFTVYFFEKVLSDHSNALLIYVSSVLLSLIPFTLAITSFDLILGLPELGMNGNETQSVTRLQEFSLEMLYLLDNHITLSALLLLPRINIFLNANDTGFNKTIESNQIQPFHQAISPPLEGNIQHIEAQEHYIRIITDKEKRMVLYRFSDAVREMPESMGMQVHRSHWVEKNAIKELMEEGQKLQIKLLNGNIVPVSRSFQSKVKGQL